MEHPLLDLLGAALVPELGADVTAGAPGHVELALLTVAALGALPHQLAVVLHDPDLPVKAAHLAVVALGVQLGVHDVVVDEAHDLEHGLQVLLHVGHLHIADGAAGGEVLELGLEFQLVKGVDILSDMDMVAVGDVALVSDALDDAERMLAEEEVKPDIVFFDMPGTLKSNGVVKTLSQMDYIFAPMSADRFVVESTLQFAVMFRDNLMTTGQAKTKGLYLFWTMVDGREKNGLYDLYEDVIAEMGLSVLSTRLPDSKKFRRDLSEERKSVFRSTIFPMDASLLKGSGIREFSEEISRIIKPQ